MTSAPGRGASKSQLFHYFPEGREQLLLAVARYEADLVLSDQQPQLGNLTSWAAWLAWRDTVPRPLSRSRDSSARYSALITQLGRATPGAQAVVAELMGQWHGADHRRHPAHMQAAGEIKPRPRCRRARRRRYSPGSRAESS